MLKIRLKRVGRKHDPSFRVILTESTSAPQTGKVIENLGSYDPRKSKNAGVISAERISYWLSKGAQASDTVWNLLVDHKIVEGKKKNVLPKKKPIKKEGADVAEASAPAPAPEAPAAEETPAE